jgi:hypothetical protein
MKTNVTLGKFRKAFEDHGSSFTEDGLEVFYDWLIGLEGDSNEAELEVAELCCYYSELTFEEAYEDLLTDHEPSANECSIPCGREDHVKERVLTAILNCWRNNQEAVAVVAQYGHTGTCFMDDDELLQSAEDLGILEILIESGDVELDKSVIVKAVEDHLHKSGQIIGKTSDTVVFRN